MSGTDTAAAEPYSMDYLLSHGAEWKDGYGKSFAIATSTSAIVSTICSSLLIAMILRSNDRLSTAYHRLLTGMAVGDVLFSLPNATFHATIPRDTDYMVWNARGSQATCTLEGFIVRVGATLSLLYTCGLILYYLARVKVDDESLIRSRIEPFLHGVPILTALAQGVTGLVNENYNSDGVGGCTHSPIYDPPHCVGYEDGAIREGFAIPCGRGKNESLYRWFSFVVFMATPVVIIISFGMIYGAVRRQERRTGGNSVSRAVMKRAFAYAVAYFVSWIWVIIGGLLTLANAGVEENPLHDRPDAAKLAGAYLWSILVPLQGMFNFLVYIHPKVKSTKQSGGENLSWPRAFAKALSTGLGGHEKEGTRNALGTNSGPRGSEMEDIDDVVLDAEVELATDVSAPIEKDESTSKSLKHSPPLQSIIPFATLVPGNDEEEKEEIVPGNDEEEKVEIENDGVENNEAESGGQRKEEEDARGANADTAASPQGIDPKLRSILEERGVVVATLEHTGREPEESINDDCRGNHAEKLHQMTQRLSTVDIIPSRKHH